MKTCLLVALLGVAACGGGKSETKTPISGQSEAGSLAPMDTLLTRLEALRPHFVMKDGKLDCATYSANGTAAVVSVEAGTADANAARTSAKPDDVVGWQQAHAPALEKLINEVASP